MAQKFEVILPSTSPLISSVKDMLISKYNQGIISDYAFAEHIKDELSSFQHWHLGFKTNNKFSFDAVAKWFIALNVPNFGRNNVQAIKHKMSTYLCYLAHKTKDAIAQGKSEPLSIESNMDIEKSIATYMATCDESTIFEQVKDDILSGKLTRFQFIKNKNYGTMFAGTNNYRKIMQVFDYYDEHIILGGNRMKSLRAMWISGLAGKGKTTLAKYYCTSWGYDDMDIYVTSSGRNPFDEYIGQPCVIVDDIDSETMTPKTALKLVDTFTKSATCCRYNNKLIDAAVVIFTSTVGPKEWWKNTCNDKTDGNVFQLQRRLNNGWLHITDVGLSVTIFNPDGSINFTISSELPSSVRDTVNSFSSDERASVALSNLGINQSEVQDKIDSYKVQLYSNGACDSNITIPFTDDKKRIQKIQSECIGKSCIAYNSDLCDCNYGLIDKGCTGAIKGVNNGK